MELESAVLGVLGGVHDPCCREREISIVDMGLVRAIDVADGHADVELMLTSGWCPFAARILDSVREQVEALDGIDSARVEITWDEAWTPERMAPRAPSRSCASCPSPPRPATATPTSPACTPRIGAAHDRRRVRVRRGRTRLQLRRGATRSAAPGKMFSNHLYAFHAALTPDGETVMPADAFLHEWSVDEIDEMVFERSDTDMLVGDAAAAHRPVPRRPLTVGEVRRAGAPSGRTGASSGAR